MANYPKIQAYDGSLQVTDVFGGINTALRIREGEWSEARNLTAEHYPLLATRRPRVEFDLGYGTVIDMIEKANRLWVLHEQDGAYKLNNYVIGNVGDVDEPTQLISMGAYIIVLGAKYWYNTADGTSGMIEASFRASDTALDDYDGYKAHVLTLCPCDADGNELRILKAATAKRAAEIIADPSLEMFGDGDCLADGENKVIRKWHGPASTTNPSTWEIMPNLLLLRADGIASAGFRESDSVEISGVPFKDENGVYAEDWDPNGVDPGSSLTTYNSKVSQYDDDPNGTRKIQKVTADAIVLKDVFFTRRVTVAASAAGDVSLGREMPDMDFIVEAQNRLWGCRYGEVDGKLVNEIYASELGNFFNWRNYDGTSMASYAASVGTDGPWTGAISYGGYPLFFKKNCMHKVFPSSYGAHQIKDYTIDGVKDGCWKSLCIVDNVLYYAGKFGIYAYTGGTSACISDALGFDLMRDFGYVVAGGANGRIYFGGYYAPFDQSPSNALFVYDARSGIWHEESVTIERDGATTSRSVVAIEPAKDNVFIALGTSADSDIYGVFTPAGAEEGVETDVSWSCTSGLIGWETIEQKYVSLFDLRFILGETSKMTLEIEYDSSGTWEKQAEVHGGGTGSVHIPVRPRRCDHFRIKLHGTGDMKLYSIAKRFTKGSGVT